MFIGKKEKWLKIKVF